MASSKEKTVELLDDISFENPLPEERWFNREDFDPMHGLTEIHAAARKGLIEVEETANRVRFRFTAKGRSFLAKAHVDKDIANFRLNHRQQGI